MKTVYFPIYLTLDIFIQLEKDNAALEHTNFELIYAEFSFLFAAAVVE